MTTDQSQVLQYIKDIYRNENLHPMQAIAKAVTYLTDDKTMFDHKPTHQVYLSYAVLDQVEERQVIMQFMKEVK